MPEAAAVVASGVHPIHTTVAPGTPQQMLLDVLHGCALCCASAGSGSTPNDEDLAPRDGADTRQNPWRSLMNERTEEILAFIKRHQREHGFPPTIREIGEHFGISSTNGVRYHLSILEKLGLVTRTNRLSRGICAVESDVDEAGIPIIGDVAAGQPILAEERLDGHLPLNDVFGDPRGLFALRVRGDSMIDAGIMEGDYVLVRSQKTANQGEMVVALVGNEATVKYYRPRGERIELVPANENYSPIVIDGSEPFELAGVVRGVVRTVGR